MGSRRVGKSRREALKKVRDKLADGSITSRFRDSDCRFDIGVSLLQTHSCGTIACIGGWMGIHMGLTSSETKDMVTNPRRSGALRPLFYPNVHWSLVTPEAAVRAIDSFLETGDPNWEEAVKS